MLAGLAHIFVVGVLLTTTVEIPLPMSRSVIMVLNAIAEKLKRQSKDDFTGGISIYG